jgi:hypothetical protein
MKQMLQSKSKTNLKLKYMLLNITMINIINMINILSLFRKNIKQTKQHKIKINIPNNLYSLVNNYFVKLIAICFVDLISQPFYIFSDSCLFYFFLRDI